METRSILSCILLVCSLLWKDTIQQSEMVFQWFSSTGRHFLLLNQHPFLELLFFY